MRYRYKKRGSEMTDINFDELTGILPINDSLKKLALCKTPAEQLLTLREIYPSEPLVKVVQALYAMEKIDVFEMAILLSSFPLQVTAGTLKQVYQSTSNSTIVSALKQEHAYPTTSRNDMLSATRWHGDDDNPGMSLSQFESIAAVTPNYPVIQVLNYGSGNGAYLTAVPSAAEKVFTYENDRNASWNWSFKQEAATANYKTDNISVVAKSDTQGRGLFNIGPKKNWYYDLSLFPNTQELHQQILALLAYSCGVHAGSFTVAATSPWMETGVETSDNNDIEIIYKTGKWTCNPQIDGGLLYGPEGSRGYIAKDGYAAPGQVEGALVGRIEDDVFFIGELFSANVPAAGEIELCINDDLEGIYGAGLTDNKGAVEVVIIRSFT